MRLYLGLIVFFFVGLAGCAGSSPNDPAEPVFSPQLFSARSATVANKYFPLGPGRWQQKLTAVYASGLVSASKGFENSSSVIKL